MANNSNLKWKLKYNKIIKNKISNTAQLPPSNVSAIIFPTNFSASSNFDAILHWCLPHSIINGTNWSTILATTSNRFAHSRRPRQIQTIWLWRRRRMGISRRRVRPFLKLIFKQKNFYKKWTKSIQKCFLILILNKKNSMKNLPKLLQTFVKNEKIELNLKKANTWILNDIFSSKLSKKKWTKIIIKK